MNQFLLDTNVILWLSEDKPRIKDIKQLVLSGESQVYVSTVSWWEIAIKIRAGKLAIDLDQLQLHAKQHAFIELPISSKYMSEYLNLSDLHKDPFDHMLLAQAINSPMRLITGDPLLAEYSSLVMVI